MYCPRCGAEFREGIERCSDCGAELIPGDRPEEPRYRLDEPPPDPVVVFTTRDAALVPVARSLLEGDQVPHFVRGEQLQDLFGIGRLGLGYNPLIGEVEIEVAAADAERARELLLEVGAQPFAEDAGEAGDDGEEDAAPARETEETPAPGVAGPQARRGFRLLVLAEMGTMLIPFLYEPRWPDEVPDAATAVMEVYDALTGPIAHSLDRLATPVMMLSLAASAGLIFFWRPARTLYALTWCFWLLVALLGGPDFLYGFDAAWRLTGRLLGGAILALSSYGPIADVFENGGRRPGAAPTSPE